MASGKQSLRIIFTYLFIFNATANIGNIFNFFKTHSTYAEKEKFLFKKLEWWPNDPFVVDEFSLQPCMIYPHRWKHEQIGNISDIN